MIQVDILSHLGRVAPPADREAVVAVERILGMSFPAEYVSLLTVSNGYSPTKGKAADYSISLYAVEELVEMAAA
jgi:hypothetical protein